METAADAGTPNTVVVALPDGGEMTTGEPFDTAGGYISPDCAAACVNLSKLHCPEAITRPGEDSCYVVCRRAAATNGRIDFKPRCVAAAKTLPALKVCGTYRCQ